LTGEGVEAGETAVAMGMRALRDEEGQRQQPNSHKSALPNANTYVVCVSVYKSTENL
jgi:hypothetical protein